MKVAHNTRASVRVSNVAKNGKKEGSIARAFCVFGVDLPLRSFVRCKCAFTFHVFSTDSPLHFLCSGQIRSYVLCVPRKFALTFLVFGAGSRLHLLCPAMIRPYVLCVRGRFAFTFDVFGTDSPLRFLWSAQNCYYI